MFLYLAINSIKKVSFILLIIVSTIAISNCSSDNPAPTINKQDALISKYSDELNSSGLYPELTTIFVETCAKCHTKTSTGAPLAGDTKAWKNILAKGMEPTLDRVIDGYGGMPPSGQCFDCSLPDLIKLILFMAK